jgi:Tfp pilus assembly protein PilF
MNSTAMRFRLLIPLLVWTSAAGAAVSGQPPDPNADAWTACRNTSTLAAVPACSGLINTSPSLGNAELGEAYLDRGSAYFRSSNPKQALGDLDRAIMLDPTLTSAYVIRGAARAQTGDLDAALADFNAALATTPDDPLLLVDRARTYAAKGDFSDATGDLGKAITIDPMFAFAIAVRGALNEVQGKKSEAMADFNAALAIDPTLDIARQGRARLLASPSP